MYVLIPQQTKLSKSPLIHHPAWGAAYLAFVHCKPQNCQLPIITICQISSCGTSDFQPHPFPPLPQHHHRRMHMLITRSYLYSVFFSFFSLSLYLSLSGNLDRWAPWWLALPIHNRFISSAYLLIIVFLRSGLLCPGVGCMRPWSWVLIWLSTDKGRGRMKRTGEERRVVEVLWVRKEKRGLHHVKQEGGRWWGRSENIAKLLDNDK